VKARVPDARPKNLSRELLSLARLLMGYSCLVKAGVAAMKEWVQKWYEAAGKALSVFGWAAVWAGFLDCYEHVASPAGQGVLDSIYAAALAAPLPPAASRYKEPWHRHLVALVYALGKRQPAGQSFFLAVREAARLLGVDKATAARQLLLLAQHRVLVLISKGRRSTGMASEYRLAGGGGALLTACSGSWAGLNGRRS
jgi:hypothetical protein